jgi:hypothetical protein
MKTLYNILTVMFCSLMMMSCSDNDYKELDKGHDVLTLTANQTAEVLNEANHAGEAITLNWTTGTNYGKNCRIYYTLEIAPAGSDFANAYVAVDNETQVYSWTANQENLNALLLDKFGGKEGQTVALDARVTACVSDADAQISTISFSATPYTPVTSTLYLVGDATPNGWDAGHATEMKRTDNGKFTWEGNLNVGSFKFLTTLGEWIPSYNKDIDGSFVFECHHLSVMPPHRVCFLI